VLKTLDRDMADKFLQGVVLPEPRRESYAVATVSRRTSSSSRFSCPT